jgi:tetratricopeptide (TPR) repeat protein
MVNDQLAPFPRKNYQHQFAQSFQALGQSAQNVLVFYGEDGLGKTTLRKLLENEYRAQSVVLNGAAMKQFNDTGSDDAIALIYNQLKQDGILLKGFYRVYAYWSEWTRLGQSFDPNNLAERVDKGDMISTAGDILGQVHPAIGLVSKLAWFLLRFLMEYGQQKEILQKLNDGSEQVLEATHPDTASSLNNLAKLYNEQGRYREAEPLLARSIEIAEKALGANHPHTEAYIRNFELMRQKMRSDSSDSA